MKKILVCDDDRGILGVLQIILEKNHFKVAALDNGRAIQKKVSQFVPDLILLDLWMPGIDGKEICKLLKSNFTTKDIPIIIFSALGGIRETTKEIGANDYISKPYDMNDLLQKINSNLSIN